MMDDMTFDDFLNKMTVIEAISERQTNELFGDKDYLPEDESEIVWNWNLSHEQKLAKLKVIRAGKRVKAKSFGRRLTRAGRIHAQALGIKLD